jgi:capsule polysaccharide export protein KpsE/RkpR
LTQYSKDRELQPASLPPKPAYPIDGEVDRADARNFDLYDFEEKSIRHLSLLWTHRKFLVRALAAGLLCGLLLAFLLRPEYQSVVQLMPPDNQSGSGMAMLAALSRTGDGGLGGVASDLLGVKSSSDLFVGMLHSRTVQDRLVQRFNLKTEYRVRLAEDARNQLANNTGVGTDRKSGIITITVTDRNPQRAATLASGYVEELDKLVAEVSVSSARRERMFLEERLKAVKVDLDQAAQDFSQFSSKNEAIDLKEQGRAMVESAARLQGELIAAESELKGLQQIYAPNNVRVREVDARVAELRNQLNRLGGTSEGTAESDAEGSPSYPSIRQLPLLGVTYADLYRRTKIQETVYETLTQEYELAKVQEAKETPSVKVLDEPVVPERKSFPPRTLIAIFCGLLALAGAAVGVLLQAAWQRVDSQRPSKLFAHQVMHSIETKMPWMPPNGSRFHAVTHRAWVRLIRRSQGNQE